MLITVCPKCYNEFNFIEEQALAKFSNSYTLMCPHCGKIIKGRAKQ